ncbi:phosphonate C-P lyase system protein PhnH [Falsirhodobacter sp. alg1]|uniref:phosphonate C-P lyase system protein PhnH n=1 Tax=Falsirhodobacter sp. alg1 TaxID=1472418 RepID=UPI0005ED54E7
MADILAGGFSNAPHQAAHAFRVALDAMARPGTRHCLETAKAPAPLSQAAATLLLTLADTTTPVYLAGACNTPDIQAWVRFHTGAPLAQADAAAFAIGTWEALAPLERFATGTAEYPDRSTTLIVELAEFGNDTHRLTGPGIDGEATAYLPGDRLARFPLGVDLFLTSGATLSALPRSTKIEAL